MKSMDDEALEELVGEKFLQGMLKTFGQNTYNYAVINFWKRWKYKIEPHPEINFIRLCQKFKEMH